MQNAGFRTICAELSRRTHPNAFTHVYIVVPKNQKTNDLSEGYYTIDGTIRQFAELKFLASDDVFIGKDSAQKVVKTGMGCPSSRLVEYAGVKNNHKTAIKNQNKSVEAQEDATELPLMTVGKRGAWQSFIEAINAFDALVPNNPDLLRLKRKVHLLAKQGREDVHFFIDGFTIVIDGERFDFIKTSQGMAAPELNLDALIAKSYNDAAYFSEAVGAQKKMKTVSAVNSVSSAVSSVATVAAAANVIPVAGQIISACAIAVAALVSLAVMFGHNPCAGAFYKTEYINDNLQVDFYKKFKETIERVKKIWKEVRKRLPYLI